MSDTDWQDRARTAEERAIRLQWDLDTARAQAIEDANRIAQLEAEIAKARRLAAWESLLGGQA